MRAQPSVGGPDDKSLKAGLTELGLGGQGELERNLRGYMLLLAKWNQTYNLISSRTTAETLSRHILDSLVVLPFLDGSRVLDVGTGAGLPGMVLAMADPRRHYTLLDVNAKKIRFCRQACAELSLTNVDVVQSRVQDYAPGRGFSTIVSRAYTTVERLLEQVNHLCAPGVSVLVMKGAKVMNELERNGAIQENTRVEELRVPGLGAKRHLVIVKVPHNLCPK